MIHYLRLEKRGRESHLPVLKIKKKKGKVGNEKRERTRVRSKAGGNSGPLFRREKGDGKEEGRGHPFLRERGGKGSSNFKRKKKKGGKPFSGEGQEVESLSFQEGKFEGEKDEGRKCSLMPGGKWFNDSSLNKRDGKRRERFSQKKRKRRAGSFFYLLLKERGETRGRRKETSDPIAAIPMPGRKKKK